MATGPHCPYWVDRRHGWEPVMKLRPYKYVLWKDWFRVKNVPTKKLNWDELEHLYKKLVKPKKSSPVTFRIKRSPKTKQFRCVVQAGNGEVILTGEPCKNRRDVIKMIGSVYQAFGSGAVTMIDETVTKKKPRLDNVVISKWP